MRARCRRAPAPAPPAAGTARRSRCRAPAPGPARPGLRPCGHARTGSAATPDWNTRCRDRAGNCRGSGPQRRWRSPADRGCWRSAASGSAPASDRAPACSPQAPAPGGPGARTDRPPSRARHLPAGPVATRARRRPAPRRCRRGNRTHSQARHARRPDADAPRAPASPTAARAMRPAGRRRIGRRAHCRRGSGRSMPPPRPVPAAGAAGTARSHARCRRAGRCRRSTRRAAAAATRLASARPPASAMPSLPRRSPPHRPRSPRRHGCATSAAAQGRRRQDRGRRRTAPAGTVDTPGRAPSADSAVAARCRPAPGAAGARAG
ncbi:hypothetical protein NB705_001334 [Xanthomonas sacchari]|nr:hypothetical protein [Xanthomonas sacchari]